MPRQDQYWLWVNVSQFHSFLFVSTTKSKQSNKRKTKNDYEDDKKQFALL